MLMRKEQGYEPTDEEGRAAVAEIRTNRYQLRTQVHTHTHESY